MAARTAPTRAIPPSLNAAAIAARSRTPACASRACRPSAAGQLRLHSRAAASASPASRLAVPSAVSMAAERCGQHIAPDLVAEVMMRGGQHRTRRGREPGVERRQQRGGEIDRRAAAVGADHDEQRVGPFETHRRVEPRIAADAEERPAGARVAPLGGDLGRSGRRADDGDQLSFGLEDLYAIVAAIGDRHQRDPFDLGILAFEARRHDDHVRRLIELTGSRARLRRTLRTAGRSRR